ncbi:hypothetical protein TcG_06815 [Trypanosoma cruzi]|nr:hypothetical protein BCY84_22805 [Trypanosoma cruzi cruzi]RNF15819.1 hypothetical protein TcG_06815 [Trypanosoma cruzi]
MTTEKSHDSGATRACWQRMLTNEFRDNPDERLKLYSSLANIACKRTEHPSDSWTAVMLKAAQDSWSRIRQLGRENILREVSTDVGVPNKDYSKRVLSVLLSKWPCLEYWYEREGFLLLLLGLLSTKTEVVSDVRVLSQILLRVVLPALLDPQVSLREVAGKLMVQIAGLSRELAVFIRDYMLEKLEMPLEEKKEFVTCEVEGLLSGTAMLMAQFPSIFHSEWWKRMQPLFQQLAIHSAASVRQRVAGLWASRSVESFEVLCMAMVRKSESPSDGDEWWRMVEVLLMALQEQLTHLLTLSNKAVAVGAKANGIFIADSLHASLLFAEMPQFEVARMGKQLVPLLTQFWVRFSSSLAFVEDCCGPRARRFRKCVHFPSLFLPELIWFLALWRYVHSRDDVEKVRKAVTRHLMPLLSGKWDVSLNSHETGKGFSQSEYSLAVLMLCTYFPDCFTESLGRDLMEFALSEEAWKRALSGDIDSARYGVDFALSVRSVGGTVAHLVPVWLQWLPGAYAHQQCLILEAVKIAIGSPKHWVSRRPFYFVYRSSFDAPTIQDGGEDVSRGFYWLKLYCPTVASLPEVACSALGTDLSAGEFPVEVHEVVYESVYVSKGTEHSVLNIVRSLMQMECEATHKAESIAVVSAAVVARLENVSPSWRDALSFSLGRSGGASDTVVCNTGDGSDGRGGDFDDWDDSDSGFDADGIAPETEIREARSLLMAILENCFGADEANFLRAMRPTERKAVKLLMVEAAGGDGQEKR